MADIIKLGILGLVGAVLAVQFKTTKPEYATYIGLAIGVLVSGYVLRQFKVLVNYVDSLKPYFSGYEGYLMILMKVIGITYVCEFCGNICKDAGYGSIADQLESVGKLAVMFAGFPILLAVLKVLEAVRL